MEPFPKVVPEEMHMVYLYSPICNQAPYRNIIQCKLRPEWIPFMILDCARDNPIMCLSVVDVLGICCQVGMMIMPFSNVDIVEKIAFGGNDCDAFFGYWSGKTCRRDDCLYLLSMFYILGARDKAVNASQITPYSCAQNAAPVPI